MDLTPHDIVTALRLDYCSFFQDAVRIEPVGNSVVHCCQWFPLTDAFAATFQGCTIEQAKIGLNYVVITGPMPEAEELHIHISGIVTIVTSGAGYCLYEKDRKIFTAPVSRGDVAIIPRGAPHSFYAEPGVSVAYAVIEFGPEIDYQKHHYTG